MKLEFSLVRLPIQAAQIPSSFIRSRLKTMYEHYNCYGFLGGNALVLKSILGREPRPLRHYFCELASR